MQSSKLVIRSWQCHILWLFNQDLPWRTKFLGQLTRSALIFPTVPLSSKQCCCSLTLWLGGGYYSSFYKSWTNVENQFVFRNLKAQRWTSVENPGRCVHHYCKCLLWNTCILMPFGFGHKHFFFIWETIIAVRYVCGLDSSSRCNSILLRGPDLQ